MLISYITMVGVLALTVLPPHAQAKEVRLDDSVFAETTRFFAEQGTPMGPDSDEFWQERQIAGLQPERKAGRDYGAVLVETQRLAEKVARDCYLEQPETWGLLVELFNQDNALDEANKPLMKWFASVEAKLGSDHADEVMLQRHAAAVAAHEAAHGALLELLKRLRAAAGDEAARPQAVELLADWFEGNPATDKVRLSDEPADFPFGMRPPQSVVIDRAELDLSPDGMILAPPVVPSPKLQSPPVSADTAQTLEVKFTPEIVSLASSLGGSPRKIFNWVRNNIEFDPYVGSLRGAAETLRLRAGNDMDQASLLIALLRTSGIPARYTIGMVEMETAAAMNWLGVADPVSAGSLLTTAGLEGLTITNGSTVEAIRCRRVWVEAYVPYTNYRGAGDATGESLWVRMDPAFKTNDLSIGAEITGSTGFNPDAFLQSYFTGASPKTVIEAFESELTARLATLSPPRTLEQNQLKRSITQVDLPWLPASLPNRILTVDSSFAEVPADRRFKVRFLISGQGATMDQTVDLPSIAGKQVTISYIGATATDVNAIAAAGGVFGVAQPWLIQVKPQLRVDGCVVATGVGSVTLGKIQNSQFYFTSPAPGSTTESITNTVIAGNYQGNAIDTGRAKVDQENKPLTCPEDFTGGFLYRLGMLYLELNDQADRRTAADIQAVLWKGVSNAILAQQVKVAYSGGTPVTFDYAGLSVDADRAGATPFTATGNNILYTFARIRGAQSSQNENIVFEKNLGRESVSTIKILQLASLLGIPLFNIDSSNAATLVPQLNHSASTESSVVAEINAGKRVTIPRDSFTYINWSGTGYINYDPANGSGGYIIAGGISGGATAEENKKKPGCETVTNVEINPPAPGNVYSTCQKEPVEITVTLTSLDSECKAAGTRTSKKTIDPKSIQPGSYDFKFGSAGDCGCSEQTVTIVIKKGAVVYKDSTPLIRVAVDGLLEIAASGSQNITATSAGKPNTQWTANGQVTPTSQIGENVIFNVDTPNSLQFLPGALLPMPALFYLISTTSPVSHIEATNVTDTCGKDVDIYAFPGDKFQFSLALDRKKRDTATKNLANLQSILRVVESVEDIFIGLDIFADKLKSPFKVPKPAGSGSIFISDQIKEVSNSNRVEYVLSLGVNGEYGLKGEFPLGTTAILGIPPALANASIFVPFGGTVGAKVTGEVAFKRPGKFSRVSFPQAEFSGKVSVGVGARASLVSGFVSLTASGTSGFSVAVPIGISTNGSNLKGSASASFSAGGLTMTYQVGAVWGLWTSTDEWVAIAPFIFPNPPVSKEIFNINFGS